MDVPCFPEERQTQPSCSFAADALFRAAADSWNLPQLWDDIRPLEKFVGSVRRGMARWAFEYQTKQDHRSEASSIESQGQTVPYRYQ